MTGRSVIEHGETQHECKALVVACSDYRFFDDLHRFVEMNGLVYACDPMIIPGATRGIAWDQPEHARSVDIKRVGMLWMLHRFGHVILANHEDCGAYGGRRAFHDVREERRRHIEDMRAARRCIEESLIPLAEEIRLGEIELSFALLFAHTKPNKTDDFKFEVVEDMDGILGRSTPVPDEPHRPRTLTLPLPLT